MKINKKKLANIVPCFKAKNILVVGDLILDHHIFGKVERVSPEAPVPVVWASKENFVCGGAANVGLNLRALGAKVSLCGVIGRDSQGQTLFNHIKKNKIDTSLVVKDATRPTTIKSRVIANNQQVVRVDWESLDFIAPKTNAAILEKIKKNIDRFDAVIIEDYGKGVINPTLVSQLVGICRKNKKIITVDPKEEHFNYYRGVTALTPNLKEAQAAANMKTRSFKDIPALGRKIIKSLNPKVLLLTLGEDGMMVFTKNHNHHIPTAALEVFDVSGAGDTVISAFTLALSCAATYDQAAILANLSAGIVVAKRGAAVASVKELLGAINERSA